MTSKLIKGLFFKDPHENAPDFVMAKGSIKIADMRTWLDQQDGEWVNFDLKRSREGKPYAQVDTWKPDGSRGGGQRKAPQRKAAPAGNDFEDDETIPF